MTRLLLILVAVGAVIFIIGLALFGRLKRILAEFAKGNSKSSTRANSDKVVYKDTNVTVLKGEAKNTNEDLKDE